MGTFRTILTSVVLLASVETVAGGHMCGNGGTCTQSTDPNSVQSSDVTDNGTSIRMVTGRSADGGRAPASLPPRPASVSNFVTAYNSPVSATNFALSIASMGMGAYGDAKMAKTKPYQVRTEDSEGKKTTTVEPNPIAAAQAFNHASDAYYADRALAIASGKVAVDPKTGTAEKPFVSDGTNLARTVADMKFLGVGQMAAGPQTGIVAVSVNDNKAVNVGGNTILGGKVAGVAFPADKWHPANDASGRPLTLGTVGADGTKYVVKFQNGSNGREFKYEKAADPKAIEEAKGTAAKLSDRKDGQMELSPQTRADMIRLEQGALSESDMKLIVGSLTSQQDRDATLTALQDKQARSNKPEQYNAAIDGLKKTGDRPDGLKEAKTALEKVDEGC